MPLIKRDTKQRIQEIATNNGWNTQIVQILREMRDGNFLFKRKFLSRLTKPVELTHNWIKKMFKYQDPEFYYQLFDESENGSFEVPLGCIMTYDLKIKYLMLKSCTFYRKIRVLMCSGNFHLNFTSLVITYLLIILKMKLHPC